MVWLTMLSEVEYYWSDGVGSIGDEDKSIWDRPYSVYLVLWETPFPLVGLSTEL